MPSIIDSANESLADLQQTFDDTGIDVHIQDQGETALQTLQDNVVGGTSDIVSFGGDLLQRIVTAGIALILVFVLSVYMLIYGERVGALVRRVMPPGDGTPEDDYPTRVQKAVAGYVRGQVLFSARHGRSARASGCTSSACSGSSPRARRTPWRSAIFFGVMEMIPFVGPFLGALPPILVALFSDPLTAVWVGLLFLGLQQIEGHIVAPQIFGHTLRINPLFVIFALLFGGEVYGIVGALLALPLAAIMRETVVYLRRHLVLEPWGTTPLAAMAGAEPGTAGPARGRAVRGVRRGRRRAPTPTAVPAGRRARRARAREPTRVTAATAPAVGAAGVTKRFGARTALRDVSFAAEPGRARRDHRPQRRRQDDAALDPRRHASARTRARSSHDAAPTSAGCPSRRRSTASSRSRRTCGSSRASSASTTSRRRSGGCSTRPACASAPATSWAGSRAATGSG